MATDAIWPGAKWSIAAITTVTTTWTIQAIQRALGKWIKDGYMSFTDNPALDNWNELSEYFAAMSAAGFGYLFSKTMFPDKVFPSVIVFTGVQSILYPPFYATMSDSVKTILWWHMPKLGQDWLGYAVTFYITLLSAWTAELSKIPLM